MKVKIISKHESMRWVCPFCFNVVFIVKTGQGDYFECKQCGLLMFEQLIDRHLEVD